ncbi:MAG: phosphoglucosamine mutase [Elusimicrobia bacterium]|nr:phosphoglucosamine mutase [Elusimicrobiota bacterium]
MSQLFGTDGVRGIPGHYPLTPDLVRRLAAVAAYVLRKQGAGRPGRNGKAPIVLMGRDSRSSGAALERLISQGLASAGCAAVDAGMIPTPALSHLVPRRGALCGVVVSASHNPAEFNGIKFIDSQGFKMSPELEAEIEERLRSFPDPGPRVTRPSVDDRAAEDYVDYLRSTFPASLDLSGMRIVVDCAHGAASKLAPKLFAQLGADVIAIGCAPNGRNINHGFGALETQAMQREVVRRKAHCGFSLDGDADRAIFADEKGVLCDGDMLISLSATDMQSRGLLSGGGVVLTVMSNYGLVEFLRSRGIGIVQVPVGDRNVTEAIEKDGLSLGGENSGHIVFRRFSPTGDGMLTALQTLAVLARTGSSLSRFRRQYRVFPQLLRNVRVDARVPLEELPRFNRCLKECERRLKGKGRVLVRYSGTEPLLRILVEGPEKPVIKKLCDELTSAFKKEIAVVQPD